MKTYNLRLTLITSEAGPLQNMLDGLLARNASVNFYMWHGGSTFGLNTGASMADDPAEGIVFSPQSYDYDAPLAEQGMCLDRLLQLWISNPNSEVV